MCWIDHLHNKESQMTFQYHINLILTYSKMHLLLQQRCKTPKTYLLEKVPQSEYIWSHTPTCGWGLWMAVTVIWVMNKPHIQCADALRSSGSVCEQQTSPEKQQKATWQRWREAARLSGLLMLISNIKFIHINNTYASLLLLSFHNNQLLQREFRVWSRQGLAGRNQDTAIASVWLRKLQWEKFTNLV